MKMCTSCSTNKPLEDFNKRGRGYQSMCRICQSKTHRNYYTTNKTDRRGKIRARTAAQREANREYVLSYLKEHPCVDCDDSRIVVLQFDHVRGEKFKDVGLLVSQGYALKTVIAEIEKCDVRCANCHTIVTAERAGWSWKF